MQSMPAHYQEHIQQYRFSTVINMARAMSAAQNQISAAAFEIYRLLLRIQNKTLHVETVLRHFEQKAQDELAPEQAQVYALFMHALSNVVEA